MLLLAMVFFALGSSAHLLRHTSVQKFPALLRSNECWIFTAFSSLAEMVNTVIVNMNNEVLSWPALAAAHRPYKPIARRFQPVRLHAVEIDDEVRRRLIVSSENVEAHVSLSP